MEKAASRIIDANFNRAREALRVMEDIARFHLNSTPLSSRAKSIRHELCALIDTLDSRLLLASRDTPGDVGTTISINNQLSRANLADCLTAASRRASEALRTLCETLQTIDRTLAGRLEQLRYTCYTLEKDITLAASTRTKMASVKLYVIITCDLPGEIIRLTRECCRGGASCLQLRSKALPDADLLAIATEFVTICGDHGVISIINDRPDIAIASGADGVHLGQEDLPIAAARKLQTSPLIVGKSTHNMQQLAAAIDEAADYVGIGPVFPTDTKPAVEVAGLKYVRQAAPITAEAGILGVAIGGITLGNLAEVMAAGARAVAVCGAIANSPDVAATCKSFITRMLGESQ